MIMQNLRIKANFAYIGALLGLCVAATGGCVAFILVYKTMQILMAVCALLLLVGGAFLCWTMGFFVELTQEEIRVSAFTKTILSAKDIDYMEFSFFEDKNGVGYIYFNNGDSVVLPKKLFAPALKPTLATWAEQKGVDFRVGAREN